jgi:hypothetical protein
MDSPEQCSEGILLLLVTFDLQARGGEIMSNSINSLYHAIQQTLEWALPTLNRAHARNKGGYPQRYMSLIMQNCLTLAHTRIKETE